MDRTAEVLRANLLPVQQSVTVSLDLSQRASTCLCGMSYFHYFAWCIMVLSEFLLTANADLVCGFSPLNLVLFKQIKMFFSSLVQYPFKYLKAAFIFPLNVLFLPTPIKYHWFSYLFFLHLFSILITFLLGPS